MTPPDSFNEPPTPDEIETAQRLGMPLDLYRRFKRNAGPAAEKLEKGDGPADIVAEERLAEKMRREPGLFKSRNEAPNIFVEAAENPGEVAKTLLTIFCYLGLMFLLVVFGGDKVHKAPGIFQMIGSFVLVVPAMMLASFLWERIGEGARDFCRLLVRFWPVTLVGLIFGFGLLKIVLQR
jgi:hypothetical protein